MSFEASPNTNTSCCFPCAKSPNTIYVQSPNSVGNGALPNSSIVAVPSFLNIAVVILPNIHGLYHSSRLSDKGIDKLNICMSVLKEDLLKSHLYNGFLLSNL